MQGVALEVFPVGPEFLPAPAGDGRHAIAHLAGELVFRGGLVRLPLLPDEMERVERERQRVWPVALSLPASRPPLLGAGLTGEVVQECEGVGEQVDGDLAPPRALHPEA